jgi:deoxyribodipyrimidine photo-lyase
MKTIVVWFRNDLRVHDNPALTKATTDAEYVVPLFIFNDKQLKGENASSNRNLFLLECLADLKGSLKKVDSDLIVRYGEPETELQKIVNEVSAEAVYYSADYTPFSIHRDKGVKAALEGINIEFRSFPGRLAVSTLQKLHTKAGTPHKVFTPFWKQWMDVQRREIAKPPLHLKSANIDAGTLPQVTDITVESDLSPHVIKGGETIGRIRLKKFLKDGIDHYHRANNDMAADDTSRLSSYLHFGCLSPREIETMLPDTEGARAWHRQLCWREFYNYILLNNPQPNQEFQVRYRTLQWPTNKKLLMAWQLGETGYPAVDAGMRQLLDEGWMHNRARLIVGSFLTKDLWLNWRDGEAYFMRWLIDGDKANNNGNWQWIASVGVDPAPVYRRLYNPSTQRDKYDPSGEYVRRYVPELRYVPDKYLSQPWTMPLDIQEKAHCIIGKDYPAPVVDHKLARQAALEQYRAL